MIEKIYVPVKISGIYATVPKNTIEEDLICTTKEFTHYRGGWKGRGGYTITNHKLYWSNKDGTISCGLGAILFLYRNSDKYRFKFTDTFPKREPLEAIKLIPGMVSSPKWTVDGKERWYFNEALDACMRNYLGLVKLPTGSGKTEQEITLSHSQKEQYGTGIILVPSLEIKDQFIDRAKSYGIELTEYSSNRKINEDTPRILITTPMVFLNDMEEGKNFYKDKIRWLVTDESHHLKATTWLSILKGCPNLTRAHGFSATPVDQETNSYTSFKNMPLDDALGISNIGVLVYHKSADDLKEFLNIPFLINIDFTWDDNVYDDQFGNNPTKYMAAVHSYPKRVEFISTIHKILLKKNYNTIHHVFRKDYGKILREVLGDPRVVTWYGSGMVHQSLTNETLDRETLRREFGESIRDIIATSHAVEGLDLPNPIDCVILSEGKSEKSSVQKVGRGTRPSQRKSIVINVIDFNCAIARSQSKKRAKTISKEFGIKSIDVRTLDELDRVLDRLNQP